MPHLTWFMGHKTDALCVISQIRERFFTSNLSEQNFFSTSASHFRGLWRYYDNCYYIFGAKMHHFWRGEIREEIFFDITDDQAFTAETPHLARLS